MGAYGEAEEEYGSEDECEREVEPAEEAECG
jgi:hypothetical protein